MTGAGGPGDAGSTGARQHGVFYGWVAAAAAFVSHLSYTKAVNGTGPEWLVTLRLPCQRGAAEVSHGTATPDEKLEDWCVGRDQGHQKYGDRPGPCRRDPEALGLGGG